jgi:hypothetical protein
MISHRGSQGRLAQFQAEWVNAWFTDMVNETLSPSAEEAGLSLTGGLVRLIRAKPNDEHDLAIAATLGSQRVPGGSAARSGDSAQ